jgi:N-acyl-D-glutamate deacylase
MAFYNFALYYLRSIRDALDHGDPPLPLGQAVRKLTGELADWYGIDAGYLRPGDRADLVVVNPEGLDASLDGYHEAPMEMFGGMPRMVRRNDVAVTATMISGDVVYERGTFASGYGQRRRHGSFLRVGQKTPPVLHADSEDQDAHRDRTPTYASRAS